MINTLRPFGTPLPNIFTEGESRSPPRPGELSLASSATVRRAFETAQPVYSDLFIGLVSRRPTLSIDVPVLRHGHVVYVLAMGLLPEVFTRLLQDQGHPDDTLSLILDRQGMIIARSRDAERFNGRPVAPELLANLAGGDGGWGRAHTWDQVLVYHAYTRSPVTGWTTVVSMQEASINGPIRHSLYLWAGGAILFLSLGVGLALLMARQITIPITALVQSLDLVRRGQRFVMPQAAVQEVRDLNTTLAVTTDAIRQRAVERERRLTAEAEAAERQRAADTMGRLNQELRHVQNELAAELDGMQCLHTLSTTLVQHRDLHRLLEVILDAAIRLGHADKGNVQLFDASTGALYIVAQRGFAAPFLEFFNCVSDGVNSCSTAMQHGERVIIEDVTQSAVFMGTAALDVMLAAGARAVQSTPLLSHTGHRLDRRPGWVDYVCQISVEHSLADDLPVLWADAHQLQQQDQQYCTKPGQRDKWVKFMEEVIIPFQVSKGMVILGSFVGEEEEDLYVWIHRFASEAERQQLYAAVYESDYWKNDMSPKIPDMLDREAIKVARLEATPKSAMQ